MNGKSSLQILIECIERNTSVHICIHDLSGILENDILTINKLNRIHSSPVCNIAKATQKGLRLCFSCKSLSIKKAIEGACAYVGTCPLGLTEITLPVFIGGRIMCIIYIGNLNCDGKTINEKINRVSALTGADKNKLLNAVPKESSIADVEGFIEAASIIKNYITLIYSSKKISVHPAVPPAVRALADYAKKYYANDLSLKMLSKLYYLNDNYLGRLFKKHMGKSFSQYLNEIRIFHACELLGRGDVKIISAALSSGFNNVTYFNRIFKKIMSITPLEYKKMHKSD